MDKRLLLKFFKNQCTLEEIEQVMEWFGTEEGQAYLEERLERDVERYAEEENLLLHPEVPSEEMLHNIERARKKKKSVRGDHGWMRDHWWMRVAVVLLVCGIFAAGSSYWFLQDAGFIKDTEEESETITRIISTQEDQHRLVTLSEGTRIRLNSNSSIEVPERFPGDTREVRLEGEAYFQVASDEGRSFTVQAGEATVRVLGTEFNVKVEAHTRQVQLAVAEGRVSLSGPADRNGENGGVAILGENTFALFHADNGEILIERSAVENYLCWISGNLYFYNEPLWRVSRYLERIYGVSFRFGEEPLKELYLSADMMKSDLPQVLDNITQTLGIGYRYDSQKAEVTFIQGDN